MTEHLVLIACLAAIGVVVGLVLDGLWHLVKTWDEPDDSEAGFHD